MRLFAGAVVQGLVSGCVIALLAAGVTLVHRSTRVLNFAAGGLATFSTYVYYQFVVTWGWPAAAALPLALLISIPVGLAAELVAVRPLANGEAQTKTVGTIGLVLILQWAVVSIWGAEQRFLPALSSAGISLGGIRIGAQHLAIAAATLAVGLGLGFALSRTRAGLALSATAQDAGAARLLGVSPRAVSLATFGIAGFTGALAGILATPLQVLTPSQMTLIFVVALGASLAGGFESLPVTVGAGLALGVVQSLVTVYAPLSGLPQAAGFFAVLIVLLVVRRRINLVELLRGTA